MKTIQQKINKIATYHSKDGTSGYLLSEKQVKQIVELFQREYEKKNERCPHCNAKFLYVEMDNLFFDVDN